MKDNHGHLSRDELLGVLTQLLDTLTALPQRAGAVRRAKVATEISTAISALRAFETSLDPILQPPHVLDPSDPLVVGRLIAETLLQQPRVPLANVVPFYGSGVYALYYHGTFDSYLPASGTDTPLYVVKAKPRTPTAAEPAEQGDRLSRRLGDHKRSINRAQNLVVEDFDCRYLVVKSAWQNTAEEYLIHRFCPVWNDQTDICYGFGKHGDDPATRSNTRSPWDTLHPGRPWATREGNRPCSLTTEQIKAKITEHFVRHPPEP